MHLTTEETQIPKGCHFFWPTLYIKKGWHKQHLRHFTTTDTAVVFRYGILTFKSHEFLWVLKWNKK